LGSLAINLVTNFKIDRKISRPLIHR
jgi:hypothetical protein